MKGYLSALAVMLLSTGAAATGLTTKSVEYRYPDSSEIQYRLPWFTSADNPDAAKRINDYLFSSLINHLPGKNPQATLNQLAEKGIEGTKHLDYTIEYRKGNILTINIFAEGCGAYCESTNLPMSFDISNGNKIALTDIVKTDALAPMNARIHNDIRSQINTFVAQQKALPVDQQRVEDDEVIDYAVFYSTCYALTIDGINYTDRFFIKDNKLVFLNGRCSNHASQALDDLGNFTSVIPVGQIMNKLTPYGKSMLSSASHQTVSPTPALSDKLLYGTLGKNTKIVMNVVCSTDYIRGTYYYEKFGKPIELTGKCSPDNNQHYQLTTAAEATVKETFTLDLKDGRYQGVWESNGKTLPVRFD